MELQGKRKILQKTTFFHLIFAWLYCTADWPATQWRGAESLHKEALFALILSGLTGRPVGSLGGGGEGGRRGGGGGGGEAGLPPEESQVTGYHQGTVAQRQRVAHLSDGHVSFAASLG